MDQTNADQSVKTETQTSESDTQAKDFVPEKSAQEYAEKWRVASAEAAKNRKEKAELKQKLEARDKADMEAQGKYKDMYETSQKELDNLKGGLKKGMKRTSLKEELLAMGCNTKMVDKAIKHAELEGIEVDPESYQANADQIKFEAKRIKEEVPVFFGKGFSQPKDGTPGSVAPSGNRSVKTLSDKDLDKAFYEALKP